METILALVLIAVATWRVSYMLVLEDGPADIFLRLRGAIGVDQYEDAATEDISKWPFWRSFLAGLFSCIYCMSIWIGTFFAIFYAPNIGAWVLYSLGASSAAIFINLVHEKMSHG